MNTFIKAFGHWLVDYYLLSSLLLVIALLVVALMRQPARKLAVIRATVAGLFLLAALCALPSWSTVHLAKPKPTVDAALPTEAVTPIEKVETSSRPAGHEPSSSPAELNRTSPTPSEGRISGTAVAIAPLGVDAPSTPQTATEQRDIPVALFGCVFLVGTGLAATWLIVGACQLSRLCRESERAPSRVIALFEKIAGSVALLPRLLINRRLPSAVALGSWDATILIPRALAKEDGEAGELTCVLAHEWAHVKNGDLRLLAATRILMLLLWANPLYWMLRARVRLEQETLADAAAAELTNRHDYAAQLVDWAKTMPPAPHQSLASAVGIWEGPSQLRRRVALLLDDKLTVLRSCSPRWRLLAGALCTLLAVALSLVTLRPASAVEEPAPPAPTHTKKIAGDYQKILGHWEVVSLEGSGGRFMDLNDKSKPGQRITIPHVRAPGPDDEGQTKVYPKSPFETRWLSPQTERDWDRDDSLHLYPKAAPKRCTYKSTDGEKPHFSDDENPPQFAIYRFEGDQLTLNIGDPDDFEINAGQETTKTSAGTDAKWKWKLVIPNYPSEFKLEAEKRQLLVTLKRVDKNDGGAQANPGGDRAAAAIYKTFNDEIDARSGKTYSKEEKEAWGRAWLQRLLSALDQTEDPGLRKSLAIAALGYANAYSKYATSEKLLKELAASDSTRERAADWLAELGGLYERMAQSGLAPASILENAKRAYGEAISKLGSSPEADLSPRAFQRLITTLADRGRVAVRLHRESGEKLHLKDAAEDFRRGEELSVALVAIAASGQASASTDGGHGGDEQTYSTALNRLVRSGYNDQWFASKAKEVDEIAKEADLEVVDADSKTIAIVLGQKITAGEKDQLQGKIFGTLFEKFAKDNTIEVTEEEIADYTRWQNETTKKLHEQHKEDRQTLAKELQSDTLSERERKQKKDYLESLESILKFDLEQKQRDKAQTEQEKKEAAQGTAIFYRGLIRRWKTNKALFEKYGGRVLFQQFGMEPIDAYRDYLREQQKKGSFEIIEKQHEAQFWAYFLHPTKAFLQPEENGKQIFATPPWRQKPEEAPARE